MKRIIPVVVAVAILAGAFGGVVAAQVVSNGPTQSDALAATAG